MPLASCPDCGREVSTRARLCVHCGRPWPAKKCGLVCMLAMIAVFIVAGMGAAVLFNKVGTCLNTQAQNATIQPAPDATPALPAKDY